MILKFFKTNARPFIYLVIVSGVLLVRVHASELLTIENVRSKALEHNRTYLTAGEEVVKANSDIKSARSGVFPTVSLSGQYNRNMKLPKFFISDSEGEVAEATFGFKNDFGLSLTATQSIWKGGRVFHAYKIARLYKNYSQAIQNQVKADVLENAENLFYTAILSRSNLEVLKQSLIAREYNLKVVQQMFDQGQKSEFEVLRAKVEKSNLEPLILGAESEVILSEKRLKSYLGLPLGIEIELMEPVDDTSLSLTFTKEQLVEKALADRSEMKQGELLNDIAKKAVSVARADYYPSFEAVSTYSWAAQSDKFTTSENSFNTWTAGVRFVLPIFNGGATSAKVQNYKADFNKAQLNLMEIKDMVRLEVETAYDRLIKAKHAIDIQKNTIDQAKEGMRIANLRYESGIGTQLEVLASDAALSSSQNSFAVALFNFRTARARLNRAAVLQ